MDQRRMLDLAAQRAAEKMKAKQEARMPKQPDLPASFPGLKMPADKFTAHVREVIEEGNDLLETYNPYSDFDVPRFKRDFNKWDLKGSTLLRVAYSTSYHADRFDNVFRYSMNVDLPEETKMDELRRNLNEKIQVLEDTLNQMKLLEVYQGEGQAEVKKEPPINKYSNEIFIVHGHDESSTLNLENLLYRLGLKPIVLWREADKGRTLIEKFEEHSDAGYVFVLFTPDEVAYLTSEETKPDEQRKKVRRARPNVIFEMGFFFGRLGRKRVCCLVKGDIEKPSDIDGIVYKSFDKKPGDIEGALIKELKAAGYNISL